jgi:hypothetical protein
MERNSKDHIEEERLEAYALDALPRDETADIEEHLLFCTTCQDRAEAAEVFVNAMRGAARRIRAEEAEKPARSGVLDRLRSWFHMPIPVFAAAMATVGLIVMAGVRVHDRPGAPVDVELQAVRGAAIGTAPAGHSLHLSLDSRGVPDTAAWRIEIVDEDGDRVWSGNGTASANNIVATVDQAFKPGTYFVRLMKQGDDPIREYQLVIHP